MFYHMLCDVYDMIWKVKHYGAGYPPLRQINKPVSAKSQAQLLHRVDRATNPLLHYYLFWCVKDYSFVVLCISKYCCKIIRADSASSFASRFFFPASLRFVCASRVENISGTNTTATPN